MTGNINTFMGAVIAFLMTIVTAVVVAFQDNEVQNVADIDQATWVIIVGGAIATFLKDFQALWTREQLAKVTGQPPTVNSPWFIGVALIVLAIFLNGCAGAQSAYKAADGIEEKAKVMAIHFTTIVEEANAVKETGVLEGYALARAQTAVKNTQFAIDRMASAGEVYGLLKNAETELDLERAITASAIELAELIEIMDSLFSERPSEPEPVPAGTRLVL